MSTSQPTRSVAIGRYVLAVGAPGGTLISGGMLISADTAFVDPAELAEALERESDERRPTGELVEGTVVTASEATKQVEQAENLLRAALDGSLLDPEHLSARVDVMFDVLRRLDRDGRWEESLRLARAINGLLALAMRWADLVRALGAALRAAERLPDAKAAIAWAQHELGTLHLAAEDAAGAERRLAEAREIRQELGGREGLAATEQSLSFLCRQQVREGRLERRRWPGRRRLLALTALLLLLVGGMAGAVVDPFDPSSTAGLSLRVKGPGTVTTTPPGIRCPSRCDAEFAPGRSVSLTASAQPGSTFAGWRGGGCEGTRPCRVSVRDRVTITAPFTALPVQPDKLVLTVIRAGKGSGRVTSIPEGIYCGQDCTETFPEGREVVLTPAADVGSDFAGWSGAGCSGPDSCSVTLREAQMVTATFDPEPSVRFTLTTSTSGTGTISPDCSQDCPYAPGTPVTLTASPLPPDNAVGGWIGCDSTANNSTMCLVVMSQDRQVSARFVFNEP